MEKKFKVVSNPQRGRGPTKPKKTAVDNDKPFLTGYIVYKDKLNQDAEVVVLKDTEVKDKMLPIEELNELDAEHRYKVLPESISIVGRDWAWMYHVDNRPGKRIKEFAKYIPNRPFMRHIPNCYKYKNGSKVVFQLVDNDKNIANVLQDA